MGPKSVAIQAVPAGVGAPGRRKTTHRNSRRPRARERGDFDRNIAGENRGVHRLPRGDQSEHAARTIKNGMLLDALAKTDCPMSCPHGRPVVLRYSMKEIEKAFHRI